MKPLTHRQIRKLTRKQLADEIAAAGINTETWQTDCIETMQSTVYRLQNEKFNHYTEIRENITYAGEMIHGGEEDRIAALWADQGFTASEAQSWWDAECFCPYTAGQLDDAEIEPSDERLAADYTEGAYESRSLCYAICNGDASINEILKPE